MAAVNQARLDEHRARVHQAELGRFDKAVRVNYYLPDAAEFEPCWPILSEVFGDNPPAATMVECNLIDPKYRIEIELTAIA